MKITLDLRSVLIGLIAGVLLVFTMGASIGSGSDAPGPRYQVAGTDGHAVIVNTGTGQAWTAFLPSGSGTTDADFRKEKSKF